MTDEGEPEWEHDAMRGGPVTEADLWKELCRMILNEFPDIIRGEWNTSTPGGAIGCIRGALNQRRALLDVAEAARVVTAAEVFRKDHWDTLAAALAKLNRPEMTHRCIRCGHPVRSHRYMNPRCVPTCPCPGPPVCILCDVGGRCVEFTDPKEDPE